MAGRGCDVRVQLLSGEVLPLTVGLHTPLGIFKAQLETLTGIKVRNNAGRLSFEVQGRLGPDDTCMQAQAL